MLIFKQETSLSDSWHEKPLRVVNVLPAWPCQSEVNRKRNPCSVLLPRSLPSVMLPRKMAIDGTQYKKPNTVLYGTVRTVQYEQVITLNHRGF